MNEATSALDPPGGYQVDLQRLIRRGRVKGTLTMEEVVLVLRTVELTTEVIEDVRTRLTAEGIVLDEAIPAVDEELAGIEPLPHGPLQSVESELHEARDAAAFVAGDFDEDGPELGGIRPARSAAARRRVLRVAQSPDR